MVAEVRKLVTEYLRSNRRHFEQFWDQGQPQTFDQYLNEIERGADGDDLTLRALAGRFQVRLAVFDGYSQRVQTYGNPNAENCLRLAFVQRMSDREPAHYMVFLPFGVLGDLQVRLPRAREMHPRNTPAVIQPERTSPTQSVTLNRSELSETESDAIQGESSDKSDTESDSVSENEGRSREGTNRRRSRRKRPQIVIEDYPPPEDEMSICENCENCFRVSTPRLPLRCWSTPIRAMRAFRSVPRARSSAILCWECRLYLRGSDDPLHVWPSIVFSFLSNRNTQDAVGDLWVRNVIEAQILWDILPQTIRLSYLECHHLWCDFLQQVRHTDPKMFDVTTDLAEFQQQFQINTDVSYLKYTDAEKFTFPSVKCPHGCFEFIEDSRPISFVHYLTTFFQSFSSMKSLKGRKLFNFTRSDWPNSSLTLERFKTVPSFVLDEKLGPSILICGQHSDSFMLRRVVHVPPNPTLMQPLPFSDITATNTVQPNITSKGRVGKYCNSSYTFDEMGGVAGMSGIHLGPPSKLFPFGSLKPTQVNEHHKNFQLVFRHRPEIKHAAIANVELGLDWVTMIENKKFSPAPTEDCIQECQSSGGFVNAKTAYLQWELAAKKSRSMPVIPPGCKFRVEPEKLLIARHQLADSVGCRAAPMPSNLLTQTPILWYLSNLFLYSEELLRMAITERSWSLFACDEYGEILRFVKSLETQSIATKRRYSLARQNLKPFEQKLRMRARQLVNRHETCTHQQCASVLVDQMAGPGCMVVNVTTNMANLTSEDDAVHKSIQHTLEITPAQVKTVVIWSSRGIKLNSTELSLQDFFLSALVSKQSTCFRWEKEFKFQLQKKLSSESKFDSQSSVLGSYSDVHSLDERWDFLVFTRDTSDFGDENNHILADIISQTCVTCSVHKTLLARTLPSELLCCVVENNVRCHRKSRLRCIGNNSSRGGGTGSVSGGNL